MLRWAREPINDRLDGVVFRAARQAAVLQRPPSENTADRCLTSGSRTASAMIGRLSNLRFSMPAYGPPGLKSARFPGRLTPAPSMHRANCQGPLVALSEHRFVRCKCLLLTQSGRLPVP